MSNQKRPRHNEDSIKFSQSNIYEMGEKEQSGDVASLGHPLYLRIDDKPKNKVGYLNFNIYYDEKKIIIWNICLKEKWRGKKHGYRFMSLLLDKAAEEGCELAEADGADKKSHFWECLHFKKKDQETYIKKIK